MWNNIATRITEVTGDTFQIDNRRSVSGGCINQGYQVSDSSRSYFVKLNQASQVAIFEAEMLGLQQMCDTQTIRIPKPICWGTEGNSAYIVLEWLDLGGRGDNLAWEEMGRKLAAMHRYPGKGGFGWDINNTIGSTPQINTWTEPSSGQLTGIACEFRFYYSPGHRDFAPSSTSIALAQLGCPSLLWFSGERSRSQQRDWYSVLKSHTVPHNLIVSQWETSGSLRSHLERNRKQMAASSTFHLPARPN